MPAKPKPKSSAESSFGFEAKSRLAADRLRNNMDAVDPTEARKTAKRNVSFGRVPHSIHSLAPQGMADFVLANGSMTSNQSGVGDLRRVA